MKIPKVIRPQFEIEYQGFFGFLYALFCVCKIEIKKVKLDFTVYGKEFDKHHVFVIPKYKFVKGEKVNGLDR